MADEIRIQGTREHSPQNVDLSIPRDKMVAFAGLSGSGKSSLAFDTVFAERQCRHIEPLSSYTRMSLGRMDKPDADFIEGFSLVVSVDQKSMNHNPCSTVDAVTEIYDYLCLLFARAGVQLCPERGRQTRAQSAEQIADSVSALSEGTCFQIPALVARGRKGKCAELFSQLTSDESFRARVDDEVVRLDGPPKLEKNVGHDIDAVVDRFIIRDGIFSHLNDSIEMVLKFAGGFVTVEKVDAPAGNSTRGHRYSEKRSYPNGHKLGIEGIESRTFPSDASYNACPACSEVGSHLRISPRLVVPDDPLTLREDAVAPWATYQDFFIRQLEVLGGDLGFDVDTP